MAFSRSLCWRFFSVFCMTLLLKVVFCQDSEVEVIGVGSSMSRLLLNRALVTYKVVEQPSSTLSYDPINSRSGLCRVKDYYTYCDWDQATVPYADFATAESTLTEEDKLRWPDLLLVPLVAHAVVVVVNIPGWDPLAPNLILDRDTLALIFSGKITGWRDPRIVALQLEVEANMLPDQPIKLFARADVSGTTQVFKKALSSFSEEFAAEIGVSDGWDWPGVNSSMLNLRSGNAGVASGVVMEEFSIGYCDLATALDMKLRVADIMQESGTVVSPDLSSVEFAMFEKGMELQSDHTADIINARGDNSWPISTYTYVLLRTNTRGDRLRAGASCSTVRETVMFLQWMYTSHVMAELLPEYGAVALAKSLEDLALAQLNHVWCDGQLIQENNFEGVKKGPLLTGRGISSAVSVTENLFLAYQVAEPKANLAYQANDSIAITHPLQEEEPWRVVLGNSIFQQDWFTLNQYNELHELTLGMDTYLAMPWYLFPITVIYHIPEEYAASQETLVLDLGALRALLDGDFMTWDDARLTRLNPWLVDIYFDNLLPIYAVEDENDILYRMLNDVLLIEGSARSNNNFAEIHRLATYKQVFSVVDQTPGAMAIVPFVSNTPKNIRLAAIDLVDPSGGHAVTPSVESLRRCVGPTSFDPVTFQFTPEHTRLGNPKHGCYPLVCPINTVMHFSYSNASHYCESEESPGSRAQGFMRYLFLTGPETELGIEYEMALPLMWGAGSEAHQSRVQQVMEYMPCGYPRPEEPPSVDMFMIILMASLVAFVVLVCISGCLIYHARIRRLRAANPLYGIDVPKVLNEIYDELADMLDGEVATYIPQLATAPPDKFGIAVMTCDGHLYSVGDCHDQFTIQSISKPFIYAFTLTFNGVEFTHEKVGVEPSGGAFNSEKMSEDGRPFNPYINAGAIACVGILSVGDGDDRYNILRDFFSQLSFSGNVVMCNETYYSEAATADQNRLIGRVLLENGILTSEYDMEHGLEAYFMACSTLVSTIDLATMGAVLAAGGTHPKTKAHVIDEETAEEVRSVMMTCGMYNGAGNWMIDVGFPAKSGVSGGIMGVVPGSCGIAIYSPRLDENYNSVRGMLVCAELSGMLGLHLMRKHGSVAEGSNRTRRKGSNASVRNGGGSRRGSQESLPSAIGQRRGSQDLTGTGGSVTGGSATELEIPTFVPRKTSLDIVVSASDLPAPSPIKSALKGSRNSFTRMFAGGETESPAAVPKESAFIHEGTESENQHTDDDHLSHLKQMTNYLDRSDSSVPVAKFDTAKVSPEGSTYDGSAQVNGNFDGILLG